MSPAAVDPVQATLRTVAVLLCVSSAAPCIGSPISLETLAATWPFHNVAELLSGQSKIVEPLYRRLKFDCSSWSMRDM